MSFLDRFQKSKNIKRVVPKLPPEHQASIEIVAHQNASHEVQQQAVKASKTINKMLERNHFTVSIVVGALGRPKPKKKHG